MKQFDKFPFSEVRQMLKNGLLVIALFALSMGYSQSEDTVQLGDSDEISSWFPFYYDYNYGYSQTIYTAEELYEKGVIEDATSITKIKYKPTNSHSTSDWKDWVIYIGNTDKEGFVDETDWISTDNMVEVFDGQIQDNITENEWLEITLDTPFQWDGVSNIIIAVDQNTPSNGNNPNWAGYTLTPESGSKGIRFYHDNNNPDPDDPPISGGHLNVDNQVAQIQLVGDLLASCDGTPAAGIVEEDILNVCAGNDFIVSVSGASGPATGLERIWQSSLAGQNDWTDIDGATSNTYTVEEGIEEPMKFRYKVTCVNSDESDISDVIEVNLNPESECFCIPSYSYDCSSNDVQINNISLIGESESFDNDSECSDGNYGDYTDLTPPDLAPGATYALSVSTDYSSLSSAQVRAWIDYNQDGQFSDTEEIANTNGEGFSDSTQTFDFSVNEDADPSNYRMRVRLVYSQTDFDACELESSGETEDYTVEIIQLDACQGATTAGTIDDDFSVCGGDAFSISVSGETAPADGLEKMWQSSPEGEDDWTDVDGATTTTYTVQGGIMEATDYRLKVTCTNSNETDISDVVTVTLNPGIECYCTPEGAGDNSDEIINFSLGELDNDSDSQSSTAGYSDFTESVDPVELVLGGSYVASLTSGSGSGNHGAAIWIDYNDDGLFSSSEQVATISSSISGSSTANFPEFTVSNNPGIHRLRVQYVYNKDGAELDPCEITTSYSETEDYTVEIIELDACQGTPSAGAIDDNDFSVCAGNAFSISVSGTSDPANGLERIWQSSPEGEDDWTDIEGANSNTYYDTDGIDEPTDFRYKVTCTNNDETDASDLITVTLNPGIECYCTPEGGGDNADEIVNFSLSDLDNDSDSGSSTLGYSDFTESVVPAELIPGQSYEASLTSGLGSGNHGAAIWIDYNDDGFFNSSEKVATFGIVISDNETVIFPEFTVPNSPGMHRLRIQYTYEQHGGDLDPCEISTSSSETEDYMVNIVGENCDTPSDLSVDVENTTVVVNWTENGSATEWKLIYGAPSFNPEIEGASITVQAKPATISDLDPQTDYEIYVIANCDVDNVSDLSDSEAFTTGELSVNNQVFENFTFYPNPVKGQLTLKAGTQIENVNVYNLLGQNILSSKPNALQTQLDTGRLQSGIYLMQVTINRNTKIFRVIKE